MATWFTADLHFGHRNIIRYCDRPFPVTDEGAVEMDEAMVAGWNAAIAPDDEVWLLGDVAMGDLKRTLRHVERLQGTKHLVAGNHDRCWSGRRSSLDRWRRTYESLGFITITEEQTFDLLGHEVLLSHFPYRGDSQAVDRHVEHRPVDEGAWLVHGHIHDEWRQSGRQINVGIDAWGGRPVRAEVLAGLVESGPQHLGRLAWTVPRGDVSV